MSETKHGHAPEMNKEKKEAEPKITVDFFFSGHNTAEDVSRLPEALKNADVYVPELAGWTKKTEQAINQVSQGKGRLETQPGSIQEIEDSSLYNTKIPVVFIDIPKGHSLIKKIQDSVTKSKDAAIDFSYGNFDEAMEIEKKATTDMALAMKEREEFIADKLKKELKTLTKKFPQLKNKADIRVLVQLGTAHTTVYRKLKPELESSKITLGQSPSVFGTSGEILRRLIKNPQDTINDDLYAKGMLENLISDFFILNITSNTNKINWVSRKLVANLSTDQIRSFSKYMGGLSTVTNMIQSEEVRTRKLIRELEKMGVKLPTTEEEIDKLLNIRKK